MRKYIFILAVIAILAAVSCVISSPEDSADNGGKTSISLALPFRDIPVASNGFEIRFYAGTSGGPLVYSRDVITAGDYFTISPDGYYDLTLTDVPVGTNYYVHAAFKEIGGGIYREFEAYGVSILPGVNNTLLLEEIM